MVKSILVAMPWHQADILSIQLGSLKAFLQVKGIPIETRHYYKDILAYIPNVVYRHILRTQIGEMLFCALLFPDRRPQILTAILEEAGEDFAVTTCLESIAHFMTDVVDDLSVGSYSVVGFSTTHVQLFSSLAAAQALKARRPETFIVLGGLTITRDLAVSLLDSFPAVNSIIYGEGEVPLQDLITCITQGKSFDNVSRLVYRTDEGYHFTLNDTPLPDLDSLPTPNFSDYFNYVLKNGMKLPYPKVSLESSRGCSWGQCTFCIENTETRQAIYRRKSAAKVLDEVKELTLRHRSLELILNDPDTSNRKDIYKLLGQTGLDLRISAEVTGFVSKETLWLMRRAGVVRIQVGIEAFSSRLLKIYCKGVRLMKMVEVLKWCEEMGIELCYNIILGAPFETPEDLSITTANLAYLYSFRPPLVSPFTVTHGSRIHQKPHEFGIEQIFPKASFLDIFPQNVGPSIASLAAFHVGYDFTPHSSLDYTPLLETLEKWRELRSVGHTLICRQGTDFLDIERRVGSEAQHMLIEEPLEKAVYLACMESAQDLATLHVFFPEATTDKLNEITSLFVENRTMFSDGVSYLSLALPARFGVDQK